VYPAARLALVVLLFTAGLRMTSLPFAFMLASLAAFGFCLQVRPSGDVPMPDATRTLVRSASTLFVIYTIASLCIIVDLLAVKRLNPGAGLPGTYTAVAALMKMPVFISGVFSVVLLPVIAGRSARAGEQFELSLRYNILFLALFLTGGFTCGNHLVTILFRGDIHVGRSLVLVIGCGYAAYALELLFITQFVGKGNYRVPVVILPLVIAAELVGLVLLVPRWGLAGAGASLAMAHGAGLVAFVFLSRRSFGYALPVASLARSLLAAGAVVALTALAGFPSGWRVFPWLVVETAVFIGVLIATRELQFQEISPARFLK
ncbi:unnamed protein product, partial [marine sediment metagenome]